MSYCWAKINDIGTYNNKVTSCLNHTGNSPDLVPTQYRGTIDDTNNCSVTGGTKMWPGLKQKELSKFYKKPSQSPELDLNFWVGIDCCGLVQQVIDKSESNLCEISSTVAPISYHIAIPSAPIGGCFGNNNHYNYTNCSGRNPVDLGVSTFFPNIDYIYYFVYDISACIYCFP